MPGTPKTFILGQNEDGVDIMGEVDQIGPWQVVMDVDHHQTHEGEAWRAFKSVAITTAASYVVAIDARAATPKHPHLTVETSGIGSYEVQMYEGPTYSALGATLTNFNKNRNSSVASDVLVKYAPTASNLGTELPYITFVGTSAGAVKTGGTSRGSTEIPLAATVYLVKVKSTSANNTVATILDWYQEGKSYE